ncbi:Protein of unknown function [Lentzea albidocapillata subsp. violacea]|uniref:DUF2795 domain-containing protein n=1 Tax=Lentzea albidocapillata subsp. violacea TaxID=128104 RepID=A0A1G8RED8_9PSEU|nr:DUF2795 domain-containing protein [Lentzea albidocapillata]SDJ15291.1 Protein of unknown function [Lentzea albidocapillata subsp. violacea]
METTEDDGEAELRRVLDELSYPADKVRIVICAEVHDLGTDLRRRLHHLPHRRYSSPSEVVAALPSGTTRP